MYELICPECGGLTRWTFVRIGAVQVCPECGQAFQVEKEHFRHRVRVGVAAASTQESPDHQAIADLDVKHEDTALMGAPSPVEEELSASQEDPDSAPAGMLAAVDASRSQEALPQARTPGVVLWAGVALLGLGLLLLLLWLAEAGAEPASLNQGGPAGAAQPHGRQAHPNLSR